MAWNASFIRPFVPRAGEEQAFTFLYDHHGINAHYPPGVEMKYGAFGVVENPKKVEAPGNDQKINHQDRKRRLTTEQIDSLERCFQEEVKLEPERKMKLACELGLQPRQVAVWFQNRRARWKTKQLERLYLALKQDFDAISNQKQQLQEEVIKLKAKLEERLVAAAHTEVSGEDTGESTSMVIPSSKSYGTSYHQVGESSYIFNVDDCNNPVSLPYWGVLPAYI